MTVFKGQAGIAKETTWGTSATVSRFIDLLKGELTPVLDVVESNGIRPDRTMVSTDMMAKVNRGTEGSATFNPLTKGFGLWLQCALGGVSTGALSAGKYPHTFTPASTAGVSFSYQQYVPFISTAGGQAQTVAGCKINKFELSQEKGGLLECTVDFLGKVIDTATAVATASYASSTEPFVWNKTTITVGGVAVSGNGWKLSYENSLRDIDGSTKLTGLNEPIQVGFLDGMFEIDGIDFEATTHLDRILASTISGSSAAVVITCTGTTDTAATLAITLAACVADGDLNGLDADGLAQEQSLKFRIRTPSGGGAPVSIVYTTVDATP